MGLSGMNLSGLHLVVGRVDVCNAILLVVVNEVSKVLILFKIITESSIRENLWGCRCPWICSPDFALHC